MRPHAAVLLTLLVLFQTGAQLAEGATPIDRESDRELVDLEPWRGRVVLLDFWASWCGPCRDSFPWMAEMVRKYGEQGLSVVAVNLDTDRAAAERFLADASFDFEFIYDPEGRLGQAYGLEAMPSSILFDRDGKAAFRHEGFRRKETAEYERRLVALLEGRVHGSDEVLAAAHRDRSGVRPWQRGLLADPAMKLDTDPLDLALDDHIYFSKEATSGGRGFGGGGCGCN